MKQNSKADLLSVFCCVAPKGMLWPPFILLVHWGGTMRSGVQLIRNDLTLYD